MNLNPIDAFRKNAEEEDTTDPAPYDDAESAGDDRRPCSETGHNYEFDSVHGYFTRNKSGIRSTDKRFLFYKKEVWICTKCDSYDFRKVNIGTVEVDGETDELEVINQAE